MWRWVGRMIWGIWDERENMTIISPRNLDLSSYNFNVFVAIDYIFSPSMNLHEQPSTPRESFHSPSETPSSIYSQDSWNLPPSPAYSMIQPSPCLLQSELHHPSQNFYRVQSSSATMQAWDSNPGHYLPRNPSPHTIPLNLEPDMSDSESEYPIPRLREPKRARLEAALKALKFLSEKKYL